MQDVDSYFVTFNFFCNFYIYINFYESYEVMKKQIL